MKKHIPNAITSCNLLCGCIAIVLSLQGWVQVAVYFIFAAAIFDFFDGFVARLLNAHSPIGLQLDSLADVISFGVAPSAIVFTMLGGGMFPDSWLSYEAFRSSFSLTGFILPFAAFFIAVFSAIRLAKFNVDERQSESFIGLPTPACAMFICGLAFLNTDENIKLYILYAIIPIMSFLLVCELPMFSLKIKKTPDFVKKYAVQILFIISAAALVIIFRFPGLSAAIVLYIILSAILALKNKAAKADVS